MRMSQTPENLKILYFQKLINRSSIEKGSCSENKIMKGHLNFRCQVNHISIQQAKVINDLLEFYFLPSTPEVCYCFLETSGA